MNGRVSYLYTPESWSQEQFLAMGGFTVVFLNYNKISMIEKSAASALNQDFPLLEMFFMDDASSDGSGDVMEQIVREYRGRHKVAVVRNDENQYITGQWNIVSKLAMGNWFGMFCGDDVAHSDRVSVIAERIRQFPTLKGIATAAVDIDAATGKVLPDQHYVDAPFFIDGGSTWSSFASRFKPNGSTTFWHRSLFSSPLPRVPMDDGYLLFRLFLWNRENRGPIFLYDSLLQTIDYSLGAGVSACGISVDLVAPKRIDWVGRERQYKLFVGKMMRTKKVAITDAIDEGVGVDELGAFSYGMWKDRIYVADTTGRLMLLFPLFGFILRGRVCSRDKVRLLKMFVYLFFREFFGLTALSFVRESWAKRFRGNTTCDRSSDDSIKT